MNGGAVMWLEVKFPFPFPCLASLSGESLPAYAFTPSSNGHIDSQTENFNLGEVGRVQWSWSYFLPDDDVDVVNEQCSNFIARMTNFYFFISPVIKEANNTVGETNVLY